MTRINGDVTEERRLDAIDVLAEEEGAKTKALRQLLDVAATVQEEDLVESGETTISTLHTLVEETAEDRQETTSLPASVSGSRDWRSLGLEHDVEMDPETLDLGDKSVVSKTHSDRLPAIVALINHTHGLRGEIIRENLVSLLKREFDVSEETARKDVQRLIDRGVLYPKLEADEEIWSKSRIDEIRTTMSPREFVDLKDLNYPYNEPARKIFDNTSKAWELFTESKYKSDLIRTKEAHRDSIYQTMRAVSQLIGTRPYVEPADAESASQLRCEAWYLVMETALDKWRSRGVISPEESAAAYSLVRVARETTSEADVKGVIDRLDNFQTVWRGSSTELNYDLSVEEACQILGVESENLSEEKVKSQYQEVILETHPDSAETPVDEGRTTDEMDRESVNRVQDARDVLLDAISD
ncbi:PqqD family protein [Halopelagius longus]|uniref:J domain-containing protein n=1 Tax=Halopelagius longus TaxID=1236180 RepID=A0A1H0XNY4_9EURY|nr:PqqD family protein [Halopelagius longus]RDI71983.1 hypothetical protein DWB78_09755 [Halopelagius longus]SDQ04630.1 hypothetical protein SAMN05216278_0054 [Halopelagius longus]